MKKTVIVVVLLLMAAYWLFDHASPLPFNHESFGLMNHTIHRIMGVVFLALAGYVWWKGKKK